MTSGEVRKIDSRSLATIGVLSNPDQKNIKIGKSWQIEMVGKKTSYKGGCDEPC